MVVENGTGIVIADAYAEVAEIDAILDSNIHSKWGVLDPATKQRLIVWASRILDERMRWAGTKTHETSGLAWPRVGVRDREGILINDNVVPKPVKVAVAVLCEHLIAGNPDVANSSANLKGLKVDVVELEFDTLTPPQKYPQELSLILAGLGNGLWGRGGPKRIIKH